MKSSFWQLWLALLILSLVLVGIGMMLRMPGQSYRGPLPDMTQEQRIIADQLEQSVNYLAGTLGERNMRRYPNLIKAQDYIYNKFKEIGYKVRLDTYIEKGKPVANVEAILPGGSLADEIVVVGAHYDTVIGSPGADDNASGVAGLLEIARLLKGKQPKRTIYLVAFVNEESPYFFSNRMGSYHYTKQLKADNKQVVAMISLESIGYYTNEPLSQFFPLPFFDHLYPTTGNFIGFASNFSSARLVRKAIGYFRKHTKFPSEGIAAPAWLTGISWSDQWSFWRFGYQAIMVTDTVPFRNPHYHQSDDLPATLDYQSMARVVEGLSAVVWELAN